MSMLFSVVILSYNSQRTLDQCLSSLSHSLMAFNEPSEVFVVENGSKDSSPEILKAWVEKQPDLIFPIVFSHNTGTTVSRNAAMARSTGRYVLILDSDAYISPQALVEMKSYLDENPSVGLVAPKLFYRDGRFQMSVDKIPTLWHKLNRFLHLNKMQANIDHSILKTTPVDYAISACWMLSRAAVNDVPKFDENIFYAPEDVDYCMQLWIANYKVVYLPTVNVVHDAQELSRGFKFSSFHAKHLKGLFYLFMKYKYFFTAPYVKMNRF